MTSRNALIYLGLLASALVTLAPFGLSLLTSFTSAQQFATGTPLSLPDPPTLANYAALGDAGFGRALAVTALMTAMITLVQLHFRCWRPMRSPGWSSPVATRCSGCTSPR